MAESARGSRLSDLIDSRENNFNLLRMAAAMAVLCSHSVAVVTGDVAKEPLRQSLGVTWGSIAVDVFFVISGLLVTASIRRSDSALEFVAARLCRILPGLAVAVCLTALLIGGYFYAGTIGEFVQSSSVLRYIGRNAIPIGALQTTITGVFVGNPIGASFNMSLWTLPIEVGMYGCVLAAWCASLIALRARKRMFGLLIGAAALYCGWRHFAAGGGAVEMSSYRLPFMFFAGASALVLAQRVRLTWTGVALALALVLASTASTRAFFVAYSVCLWYIVLGLAYLPGGRVRAYNRLGDYSYGTYVYAWPVQQALVAAIPAVGLATHIALSGAITLLLGVASWHWVESPALKSKERLLALVRQFGRPSGQAA